MLAALRVSNDLAAVPESIAWKLVEPIYTQASTLVAGAVMFVALGCIGFVGTGSPWYLAGIAASALSCAWRLLQGWQYRRDRSRDTPLGWARRARNSAWLTGAVWGAWSFVLPYETERFFDFMLICVQSISVTGGSVRTNSLPAVAIGQALLALLPPLFICAFSSSRYLMAFTPFVVLNFAAAVSLIRFLRRQTLQLLLVSEEKTVLLERIQAANQELTVLNQHLETLAASDPLTGVANRRVFDLTLAKEWQRHAREETPLCLLMLDVDYFRDFNNRYGHPAGDQCLRAVANAAAAAVGRAGDALARYGGEEFAVILANTYLDDAVLVAERIRADIAARRLVHDASPFGHITVSIGVACVIPHADAAPLGLIGRADAALYAAKRGGRNTVQAAPLRDSGAALPGRTSEGTAPRRDPAAVKSGRAAGG